MIMRAAESAATTGVGSVSASHRVLSLWDTAVLWAGTGVSDFVLLARMLPARRETPRTPVLSRGPRLPNAPPAPFIRPETLLVTVGAGFVPSLEMSTAALLVGCGGRCRREAVVVARQPSHLETVSNEAAAAVSGFCAAGSVKVAEVAMQRVRGRVLSVKVLLPSAFSTSGWYSTVGSRAPTKELMD